MTTYPGTDIEHFSEDGGGAPKTPGAASFPPVPIAAVDPFSPADDAGFAPGCLLTAVNGQPIRDILDWRWHADGEEVELSYVDADGEAGSVVLEREPGEPWGFAFQGSIFDGVRLCRNSCTFCFMRQLPAGMRPSLSLRDDDYRLSFLSGTFVTLTNITPEDEARIVEQHLSPLRVSLQAVSPAVRKRIMGKHAAQGLEVLERLLAQGICFHAQVVLVPGQNDGEELRRTCAWAYERPGILELGVVPLGFTRHQSTFMQSFGEPGAARAVLDALEPFRERALAERGTPWVFAADEFYVNAYGSQTADFLPPAESYGDFSMYEDGIGIARTCIDEWRACVQDGTLASMARALRGAGTCVRYVLGRAVEPYMERLVSEAGVSGVFRPLYVDNRYFGGNVTVTGLLAGADIARRVRSACRIGELVVLPAVLFNDDGVTLDGMDLAALEGEAGRTLHVVSCTPQDYVREIAGLARASRC